MASPARHPDRRKFPRDKHRVPCDLVIEGEASTGFVTDLSPRGLFVQTSVTAAEGTPVTVRMREPDGQSIELHARVARVRRAHRAMVAVTTPGLGLEVLQAPEEFFALIQRYGR